MLASSEKLASRPTRASFAFVALALAGCTLDLELPEVPRNPTLSGFTPAAAHAGELIRVTGGHLEADATANTVNFAHATARGERLDGADLIVRVPPDAGDGPITVSNREGTSTASATGFDYLGLGEPRRLQVASSSPILHRPLAVYALGGDVVLHSSLYGGLVWAGSASSTTPTITVSAAAPWASTAGALYHAALDPVTAIATITRIEGATGSATHTFALPAGFEPDQLVPMRTSNVLAVFGNVAGAERLAVLNLADLTQRYGPSAYGISNESFYGAADVGDGRIVLAVYDDLLGFTLALLDVGIAPSTPPAGVATLAPPASAPWFYESFTGLTPLAVGRATSAAPGVGGGDRLAAVALDDGNVAVANLDGVPAFLHVIETWSSAPIESIGAAPADGTLGAATELAIATKQDDDLSIGIDLATGTLLWSVEGSSPKAASVDGPIAFVAHDGDNDVTVVNLGTGSRVGRVNLDVLPGAAEFRGAAAFVPTPGGIDGDVLFPSTAFPALLRLPTSTGEPALVARGTAIDFVDADLGSGSAWATASGAPASVASWSGGDWSTSTSVALTDATAPQRTAARGTLLAVAHDGGLSLVDGGTLLGTAAIPDAAAPSFLGLGFTPGGDVWTVVGLDGDLGTQLQRWVPGSIVSGGAPAASWTVPGTPSATPPVTVFAALYLEDGLWFFWRDDAGAQFATLVDDSLTVLRTVTAPSDLVDLQAVSPNGRLLVQRELGATLGYVLRFFRADPDSGFPELGSLVFDERVEGFAFDATGERLYVVTQNPDRVIVVD